MIKHGRSAGAPLRNLGLVTIPAVLLAGLTLALAFEAWVRVTWDERRGVPGLMIADPVRVERLASGYEGWFAGAPVQINTLGFRDPREYRKGKARGTFRIAIFGDSVTFGHGIPYEHTYPYLLEEKLRALTPRVRWEVWNLGVPGYNTRQELAYLREVGSSYEPDLIVIGFYENDVLNNATRRAPSALDATVSGVKAVLKQHLYSYGWYSKLRSTLMYELSASREERRFVASLGRQERLLRRPERDVEAKPARLPERAYESNPPPCGSPLEATSLFEELQALPGLREWVAAIGGFGDQGKNADGGLIFFVNMAPETCSLGDVFDARRTRSVNRYYVETMSRVAPTVSSHDEFLHYRPSQAPLARGHSMGRANAVKAEVLFRYLVSEGLIPSPDNSRADLNESPCVVFHSLKEA